MCSHLGVESARWFKSLPFWRNNLVKAPAWMLLPDGAFCFVARRLCPKKRHFTAAPAYSHGVHRYFDIWVKECVKLPVQIVNFGYVNNNTKVIT